MQALISEVFVYDNCIYPKLKIYPLLLPSHNCINTSQCSVFKVHSNLAKRLNEVSPKWNFSQSLLSVVESTGIEPVTSCLQGRRSPSWANPPFWVLEVVGQNGLERRLLATVRWTVATAVAFPQKSESLAHHFLLKGIEWNFGSNWGFIEFLTRLRLHSKPSASGFEWKRRNKATVEHLMLALNA